MEEYVAKSILKKELNITNLHSGIIDALQNIVDEIPAADVEEVKHGQWVDSWSSYCRADFEKYQGFQTAKCSVCNITQSINTYQHKAQYNYCPYCGAKMNEKEKENV